MLVSFRPKSWYLFVLTLLCCSLESRSQGDDFILGETHIDNFNIYQVYHVNHYNSITWDYDNWRWEVTGGKILASVADDEILVRWDIGIWQTEGQTGQIILRATANDPHSIFVFVQVLNVQIHHFISGGTVGIASSKYAYSYQQTPEPIVSMDLPSPSWMLPLPGWPAEHSIYQWQSSLNPVDGFQDIPGATGLGYTPSGPLAQTTFFRRKWKGPVDIDPYLEWVMDQYVDPAESEPGPDPNPNNNIVFFSNVLKVEVTSVNWENINYVREHDVLLPGLTDWKAIDQLPVGQKLQTTTYLDGLGRTMETVSRETAAPATPASLWGDVVQFSSYDEYGREPLNYLPYTTTTETGKFKSAPVSEQAQYYTNHYNESAPYSSISFDNTPLGRIINVKQPGTSWAASNGHTQQYDLNTDLDHVQKFTVDYGQGNPPVHQGEYPGNTLFKNISVDQGGKQVIEYTNLAGQLLLRKVQLTDNPSADYDGWICTYSIYNDFGELSFQLQPEAVKYLSTHNWSFSGTDGAKVLNELCFQYQYDAKGRTVWKKAPGAKALVMLYDRRDRPVFTQDGNQRLKTLPEWTATLYDELDRPTLTTLYATFRTIGALQTDIANAVSQSTVTIGATPLFNLSITNRDISVPAYKARTSIAFLPGFESGPGDAFTAEIDPNATEGGTSVSVTAFSNPISNADLNNLSVCTILNYWYYDNYSFAGAKAFDPNFDNLLAYPGTDPAVQPISPSQRTAGFVTGSKVRVLGTNTFLSSTHYYDDRGAQIQTAEDNIKAGTDVTTLQYHFDGRILSTYSKHTTAGSGYSGFGVLTKNNFDKIGRVTGIEKSWGPSGLINVAEFSYDDAGRLKIKRLAPGTPGPARVNWRRLPTATTSTATSRELTKTMLSKRAPTINGTTSLACIWGTTTATVFSRLPI